MPNVGVLVCSDFISFMTLVWMCQGALVVYGKIWRWRWSPLRSLLDLMEALELRLGLQPDGVIHSCGSGSRKGTPKQTIGKTKNWTKPAVPSRGFLFDRWPNEQNIPLNRPTNPLQSKQQRSHHLSPAQWGGIIAPLISFLLKKQP